VTPASSGQGVLHHPVQRTGFDLFHESDPLVGFPARLTPESVPEKNARKMLKDVIKAIENSSVTGTSAASS
jgi:hypothetical protein